VRRVWFGKFAETLEGSAINKAAREEYCLFFRILLEGWDVLRV